MKTRAAVLRERGLPAPYAQSRPLVIEELELDPPGPDEVLVQMAAAGLCHSDLSVINGTRLWPLPIVLGHEACGNVLEVGDGVTDLRAGDPVVFSFLPSCGALPDVRGGTSRALRAGRHGESRGHAAARRRAFSRNPTRALVRHHSGVAGYSQFSVVARESVVKIDADIPMETAVLFGCAVMTGVGAVVNTARVAAGTSVAVFGAGGVGLSAIMGAKAVGAFPIVAVDRLAVESSSSRSSAARRTRSTPTRTDPRRGGARAYPRRRRDGVRGGRRRAA